MLGPPELLDDVAGVSDHVTDGVCLWGIVELPDFHLGLILREMCTNARRYLPRKPRRRLSNSTFCQAEVQPTYSEVTKG